MEHVKIRGVKHGNGAIGLMGKFKIKKLYSFPLGHIDKSVHTMFCLCAMDAICLDKNDIVIKKIHMGPWKIFHCGVTAVAVIEGPVNAFDEIDVGDSIEF